MSDFAHLELTLFPDDGQEAFAQEEKAAPSLEAGSWIATEQVVDYQMNCRQVQERLYQQEIL